MGKIGILTSVLLAAMAPNANARCGPSRLGNPAISKPLVITLNASSRGVYAEPAFYLRVPSPSRSLVMFFKPDDVVDVLQSMGEWGRGEPQALLANIERELPLKTDTDIFKYQLRSFTLWSAKDWLVTELLRSGRAAIGQAGTAGDLTDPVRGDLKSIVMVTLNKEDTFWFCTADGFELHRDVRVIDD